MNERIILNKNNKTTIETGSSILLGTEQIQELSVVLNSMLLRVKNKINVKYGGDHPVVKFLEKSLLQLREKKIDEIEDLRHQYNLTKSLMELYLDEYPKSFDFFVQYFSSPDRESARQRLADYLEESTVKKEEPAVEGPSFDNFSVVEDSRVVSGEIEMKDDDDYQIKYEEKVVVDKNFELPTVPPEIKVKTEQLKYNRQLEELQVELLDKQTRLAQFGKFKGLFKKKEKLALEAAIKADQEKIEKLHQEKIIKGVHSFVAARSAALDRVVKKNEEENQKKYAGKLYAFYEKYFMKKLLPKGMREKLEKQGFIGRLLANGCTMNTALSFALLGGGLAIGGASIVGASVLSGRRVLSGAASGVGSYNLMKLGSDAWAKSHGWDKELSDAELNNFSVENLIIYLAHYEARVALNGGSVNSDSYYKKLTKTLEKKLKVVQVERHLDEKAWAKYLLEMEKTLDKSFQEALSKKVKQKSRLKYYATAVGVFIGSGMMQKTIEYLFGDKGVNAPVSKENSSHTLLAEQSFDQSTDFPPLVGELDLSAENSVDYSMIPELAEQSQSSVEEVLMPVTERTAEMLKESFSYNHSLIEKVGGAVEIVGGKTNVVFDFGVGGDFELKQQALRRVMMDVFPIQEILDKDGLSALDIGRIESNVTTFTKLLEGKSFHGFSPDILKGVMHIEGKQLIITDYEKLMKISEQVLAESKRWVPDMSSGFVRVGQNTAAHVWEKMLNFKMQNIKI